MYNIKKIAEIAGYSTSTVSRVLNNHPHVHEETRRKILNVIKKMEYSPNINAIQLKLGKSNIVGVVTPSIKPYFMQIINGISEFGKSFGYQVLIYQTEEKTNQEEAALELLRQKKVDGLIILRRSLSWKTIEKYTKHGPIVTCEPLEHKDITSIYMDHYEGFKIGIDHLISQGYIKIACILGRRNSVNSKRRVQAYLDLLKKYELPIKEEWLVSENYTVEDGMNTYDFLTSLNEAPDAVIASNDYVAAGIISAASLNGVEVPRDLAIIGFDDIQIAKAMYLTTIKNPLKKIGQQAFQAFYDQLNQIPIQAIPLEFELVVRRST